jgi:hypothetical protein
MKMTADSGQHGYFSKANFSECRAASLVMLEPNFGTGCRERGSTSAPSDIMSRSSLGILRRPGLLLCVPTMFRPKKSRPVIRLVQTQDDGPPQPAEIDMEIARNHGSTEAIAATKEKLEEAKHKPTPSLSEIIQQRTWENGQLRQELAYQRRKNDASIYLLGEVRCVVERLQQALLNFHNLNEEHDGEHG